MISLPPLVAYLRVSTDRQAEDGYGLHAQREVIRARAKANICRSRSRYGRCGRAPDHSGPHAVPIGDSVWFGYVRDGRTVSPLGYGNLDGDTFTPCGDRPAGASPVPLTGPGG